MGEQQVVDPYEASARRIWGDDAVYHAECKGWHHRNYHEPFEIPRGLATRIWLPEPPNRWQRALLRLAGYR